MDISIIDVSNQLWLETLSEIRHDVYHLPQYFSLEASRTKTIPEACLIREEEKVFFAPYLLRKCNESISDKIQIADVFDVVSPYGYPGILVNEAAISNPDFLEKAIIYLKKKLQEKGICSAFFRLHPIINENITAYLSEDIFTPNGQTVSIDLTLSESELWAHTRKGHQSTINKCKRLGFTARVVDFADYYDEFIAIYEETMNRVQANESYYFDDKYFRGLLDLKEKLHLCIVEFEEQMICASLFFESCGIIQAHLGGTKDDFIRQSPFNLLLHHMRLWGRERGNEYLHIGGGIGGSTEDSLFTFKSGFSRQRHDFLTLRLITDTEKYMHLVESRAKDLNTEAEELLKSNFFPAYRSSVKSNK
jgi:Acetyltransferase (GNAT) domain